MVKLLSIASGCALILLSACNRAAEEAERRTRIQRMADSIEQARADQALAEQRAVEEEQRRQREEIERQFAAQQAALNPPTPAPVFANPTDTAGRAGDSARPVEDSATAARRRRIESLTNATRDTTGRTSPDTQRIP